MSVRKIAGSKDLKIEKAGWWIFATWSFDITGTRWRVQMDHEGYHEAQESIAKSGAAPIVQQDGASSGGRMTACSGPMPTWTTKRLR